MIKRSQVLLLAILTLTVQAKDVSYNGVKPAIIIDVRTPNEFAVGHIENAVNIPVEQIGQGIQSIKGLKKDEPILLYCRSGRRSSMARQELERQGYKNIVDGGGMENLEKSLKRCSTKTC